ncbi:MAG: hypothetical protein KDD94_10980, partial [Calditrichaeota bacterium]|nr:hypothetical protein [Calditrichota bacterium]
MKLKQLVHVIPAVFRKRQLAKKVKDIKANFRVVISLTSFDKRIQFIQPVINSIKKQSFKVDKIHLNLTEDVKVNDAIRNDPDIQINYFSIDYGPARKLLHTLAVETAPDTLIITVDDDMILQKYLIANIVHYSLQFPDSAIAHGGWNVRSFIEREDDTFQNSDFVNQIDELPQQVDILEGYSCVAYRRSFFDDSIFDYSDAPPEAYYVDDVWFGGHLNKKQIKKIVVPIIDGKRISLFEMWKIYFREMPQSAID